MSKLNRLTGKVFGATASSSGDNPAIGQFGSAKAGTYNGTGDVAEIQSLPAWDNGWIDAVTPTQQFPTLPEMTGVHKVLSYQSAYLLKEGMPEYDPDTIYDEGGMCKIGKIIYYCTSDNNTNNPQTLNGWIVYYDPDATPHFESSYLVPFSVNSGSVDSEGNGNCLQLPSGSTTVVTRNWVQPVMNDYGTWGVSDFACMATVYGEHATAGWYAFDGNPATAYDAGKFGTNTIVGFYSSQAINVSNINVYMSVRPRTSCEVLASNDDSTYTSLGTFSNTANSWNIPIDTNGAEYKYWHIHFLSGYESDHWPGSIDEITITATYEEEISSADYVILGASETPAVITNAKGVSYQIENDRVKDMSVGYADGDYNIYASIEDGELSAYSAKLYRQPTQPSGTNVATSANAISGGSYTGQDLSSAFDGSLSTFWGCSQIGSNQINGVAYIGQSNLTKPIKKVRLYQSFTGYQLPESTYCDVIKLQYSNDGTTWIDIQTVSNLTYQTWEEIDVQDYTPTGSQHSFRLLAMNFPYNTTGYNWLVSELELLTLEDNTVWLDTSVRPLRAYKYNGSTWQEYNGVPVGTCTIESNTVTAIKTFAYNVNGIENSLIKNYQNGASGYTLEWRYNSYNQKIMRYCIQYGAYSTGSGAKTITLLVSYGTNANYFVSFEQHYNTATGEDGVSPMLGTNKTGSAFSFYTSYAYGGLWKAEGWIEE